MRTGSTVLERVAGHLSGRGRGRSRRPSSPTATTSERRLSRLRHIPIAPEVTAGRRRRGTTFGPYPAGAIRSSESAAGGRTPARTRPAQPPRAGKTGPVVRRGPVGPVESARGPAPSAGGAGGESRSPAGGSFMSRRWIAGPLLALALGGPAAASDWPQWLGPNRDGIWAEKGTLDKFPEGGPKVLWRKPIGSGYAGPAVAGGKVYVMDRQMKAAIPKGAAALGTLPGTERVLCLDAKTGEQLWKHEYDCPYTRISYPEGPRTTPVVEGDRVYTLGTMGDMLCLDAATGKPVWSKNFVKESGEKAKKPGRETKDGPGGVQRDAADLGLLVAPARPRRQAHHPRRRGRRRGPGVRQEDRQGTVEGAAPTGTCATPRRCSPTPAARSNSSSGPPGSRRAEPGHRRGVLAAEVPGPARGEGAEPAGPGGEHRHPEGGRGHGLRLHRLRRVHGGPAGQGQAGRVGRLGVEGQPQRGRTRCRP